MAVFIALLRAINVGGTGMLPMKELSTLCSDLGLKKVCTYIQSGNVIFESALAEKAVKAKLEEALAKRMGKKVDVAVRSSFCLLKWPRRFWTRLSRQAARRCASGREKFTSTTRTAWAAPN
jgi:uncharacterized protein (DUF1697 family)